MKMALERAKSAADRDEVPVGAVLVDSNGKVLASEGNKTLHAHDPAGHAEIRALRRAAEQIGNYRLPGTTLYVTLEPCIMCVGAMIHARVGHLVYGAKDPKTGAIVSQYTIASDGKLNHTFIVTGGVLEKECGLLLREFFQKRR